MTCFATVSGGHSGDLHLVHPSRGHPRCGCYLPAAAPHHNWPSRRTVRMSRTGSGPGLRFI